MSYIHVHDLPCSVHLHQTSRQKGREGGRQGGRANQVLVLTSHHILGTELKVGVWRERNSKQLAELQTPLVPAYMRTENIRYHQCGMLTPSTEEHVAT